MVNEERYENYKALLKTRLTEKRYFHSLCVADEAQRLAIKYGCDADKAYLAGLLHDVTKNLPIEEHLNIFANFGIILNDIEQGASKLWHAISGAAFVRYNLNIDDNDIYDAIRYHTTAKADMSPLSKIIYLADFTSGDRDYDDVDIMRKLVDISLENAFRYSLSYSVKDLIQNNRAIHFDTIGAYNQSVINFNNQEEK